MTILQQTGIVLSMVLLVLAGSSVDAGPFRPDLSAKDLARVQAVTKPTKNFSKAESFEKMSAGAATSLQQINRNAFSHPLPNLSQKQERDFKVGNGLFRKIWVPAPASTKASDGLGPLFNARSCQRCHLKDGRGHPPEGREDGAVSMFLRLSIPPQSDADRKALADKTSLRIAEPTYGGQLQDLSVPGLPAEGKMRIEYSAIRVELAGGEVATLLKPTYSIVNPGYGPLHPDTQISPRVSPQMIGLGLLEQIHPDDLRANVDASDLNGDGVTGHLSLVSPGPAGESLIGRFGWKASTPTIAAQSAGAFAGDIGISSPQAPDPWGDCTVFQETCRNRPHGIGPGKHDTEAPGPVLPLVTFYSRNLAVPARRDVANTDVLRGKKMFYQSGCKACHRPKYVTRRDAPIKAHRFQLIWPYTDLLLHDMGEGLSDNRPVGDAAGQDWRTAPLWGIGLTKQVNGHTRFLHDGRARNLLEAILWHGGEAAQAQQSVVEMLPADRAALLRFLNSL
jgi:CxxC motif-containing protein (DUF1111 family)